jgi:hypothetical protein
VVNDEGLHTCARGLEFEAELLLESLDGRFRSRDLSNAPCWLEFDYTEASFMRNGMRRSRFPVAA